MSDLQFAAELDRPEPDRYRAHSIDPGLGGGGLLYQVFGGKPDAAETAQQTTELKAHTQLLRELVAQGRDPDLATFAP